MERFTAHRLRFVLETRTPIYLRAHKGSALRGGLFQALRSRFCLDGSFRPRAVCRDCQLHSSCPICFLIAPVDESSERGLEVPRPYVIEPPLDGKTEYRAGEVWEFGLTMLDRALNLFPYVILGVQQLGEDGLGAGRGRFKVREVWAQNPLTSTEQRLAQWEDRLVSVPNIPITHEQVMERVSVLARRNCEPEETRRNVPPRRRGRRETQGLRPSAEGEGSTPSSGVLRPVKNDQVLALTLNLKTPLRLVKEGKLVHRLDFATIMARLFERLTALSSTYSSAPLALPFRDLLAQADRVEVAEDETGWMELERYSSRQKRPLPMGGLVGRITFRGDLDPLLPWLLWGQFTHLGKMATMGNGWYEMAVSH